VALLQGRVEHRSLVPYLVRAVLGVEGVVESTTASPTTSTPTG
jgi:hypothetical protein